MANDLHIFFDSLRTNQISQGDMSNADVIVGSGNVGFVDTLQLYMGDVSGTLKYNNATLSTLNDTVNVDVKYSTTMLGVYTDTLNLGTVLQNSSVGFWRKLTVVANTPASHYIDKKYHVTAQESL